MPSSIPYTVKPGETLASIAAKFPHIPSWYVLAKYNDLEYPYIVSSPAEREAKATGEVVLIPKGEIPSGVTIPENTLLQVEKDNQIMMYRTVNAVTYQGTPVSVFVEAVSSGSEYNIPSSAIWSICDPVLSSLFTVTNPEPILGGFRKKVLVPGETILIPYYGASPASTGQRDEQLYGSDIQITWNSALGCRDFAVTASGDLATVRGVENVRQALTHRLHTELGELPKHPEYGTRLSTLIGNAVTYSIPELINIEVLRSIKEDPRVYDVRNIRTSLKADAAVTTCQVILQSAESFLLEAEVWRA